MIVMPSKAELEERLADMQSALEEAQGIIADALGEDDSETDGGGTDENAE